MAKGGDQTKRVKRKVLGWSSLKGVQTVPNGIGEGADEKDSSYQLKEVLGLSLETMY